MKKIVKFLLITLLLLPMLGGWANAEQFKPATLINFKTGYRVAVYSDLQAQRYFSLGYELDKGLLGFSVVTNYSTTLSSSITATQTTIPVGTTKDKKGEQLATSTLGMKIYLNIEPGGNKEELVVCTGISGDNWTGCTRGLAFSGTDESAVSSYQYAHSAGSRVVMSNIHYVYQNFVDLDSNQTITGNKTFSGTANFTGGVSNFTNIPTTSTSTPTANNQIVTKGYVDGIVVAGGVTMTTTTPGIAKISSDPSNPLNPLVLNSEEVATTSEANKVVRASSTGKIDTTFIDQTADYVLTGSNTFTGISTFVGTTTLPTSTSLIGMDGSGLVNIYKATSSFVLEVSDNLRTSDDTQVVIASTTYYKTKEILLNDTSGMIRIKFTLQGNSSNNKAAYTRIYKNGIPYGTERVVQVSTIYSEDLYFETGDLIQLYSKAEIEEYGDIKDFRLYYDKKVKIIDNTINL